MQHKEAGDNDGQVNERRVQGTGQLLIQLCFALRRGLSLSSLWSEATSIAYAIIQGAPRRGAKKEVVQSLI